MEYLTIGYIEDQLRKFDKGTTVTVGCHCCNHSSYGGTNILQVVDDTDQTFGTVGLMLNSTIDPIKELATDREIYYENRLKEVIDENIRLKFKLNEIEQSIKRIYEWYECKQ